MHNAHAQSSELLHNFCRVEGVGGAPNTTAKWQQKAGDKTTAFGVNGGELAAKVGGKATHVHVRNFFKLEPKNGDKNEVGKKMKGFSGWRKDSHGLHFCLSLVAVVKESAVAVDVYIQSLLDNNVRGFDEQVRMKIAAGSALNTVGWPHHLHLAAGLFEFLKRLRSGVVRVE